MLSVNSIFLLAAIGCISCEKTKPTLKYQTVDGQVFVFDNVMNPKVAELMQNLMARNNSFSYYYPDPYEKDNRTANDGNLHWSAPLSPNILIKTRFWAGIRRCYTSLPDEFVQGRRYLPYVAHGTMLRRGDYTTGFQGDVMRKDSIFARVFLTGIMNKNAYSDQTFYDENEEIIASIHPKVARVIMWTGNVSTVMRPPSMGSEQAEYSLLLKLTPDKELFVQANEKHAQSMEKVEEHAKTPLPFTNHIKKFGFDKLNLSEHLLGKYYDKEGNMVAFFDNLLPKELLDQLRSYVTHYERGFLYNPYDPASSEHHDNVNWIVLLQIERLLNTPYWEIVKELSKYMSNSTQWYPYDVSTNLIQHTHHTRIHVDCVFREYEFTFLLYLNPNWSANMYAETSFYDYAEKMNLNGMDEGNEMYDFVAAAVPKFGRIAIFRNLIPHSARPPAPNFLNARYTFPVKVAPTYFQARTKMLMEALDYKPEDLADDPLYANLRKGDYSPFLNEAKMSWVNEHYNQMERHKERSVVDSIRSIESVLIPERLRK